MHSGSTVKWVRDPWSLRAGYIAANRNGRPMTDDAGCAFCPSGREAPAPYATPYAFPNRWPPLPEGYAVVVVHDEDHSSDFATMSHDQVSRVVDIWARTTRELAALPDVGCVLVFENRGPEAGATVAHPHSQVFALPVLPAPAGSAGCPGCAAGDPVLRVATQAGWEARVPEGPIAPYTLRLVPSRHVSALPDLDRDERRGLAAALRDAVRRLDALFATPMPYHLWIRQDVSRQDLSGQDTSRQDLSRPELARADHLCVEVAGLLRAPGRLRVLGAAEMATGLFFTPMAPEAAARDLGAVPETG